MLDMGLTFDTINMIHLIPCISIQVASVEAHSYSIRRVKTRAPKIDAQDEVSLDLNWIVGS